MTSTSHDRGDHAERAAFYAEPWTEVYTHIATPPAKMMADLEPSPLQAWANGAVSRCEATDRIEPSNVPGPHSTRFACPRQYPPTRLSGRYPGTLCAFDDGEPAAWMVLGATGFGPMTTGTPVCEGHRAAVVAHEATWI